jgi:peptidoglycan/xylan/chitin deacetylase (PgdA/CDA1 family)
VIYRKPPAILRYLLPGSLVWRIRTSEKDVYLTFDDGPNPGVTEDVLAILATYRTKATFFCVGENVARYPGLYRKILEAGHSVGNHTFNHLNGWKISTGEYLQNIQLCRNQVDSRLFRPPYGRITRGQINGLKQDYRIIMWSMLSMDYDRRIPAKDSLKMVCNHIRPGAIIVFHDSLKASDKVRTMLPGLLRYLEEKGYSAKVLG